MESRAHSERILHQNGEPERVGDSSRVNEDDRPLTVSQCQLDLA